MAMERFVYNEAFFYFSVMSGRHKFCPVAAGVSCPSAWPGETLRTKTVEKFCLRRFLQKRKQSVKFLG